MKPIIATLLLALVCGCNYSHVGPAVAVFNRPPPPLGAGQLEVQVAPLTLAIRRHADTVLHGPDVDEDQLLILRVRNYRLNVRLPIPSDSVSPDFSVTRFGPPSSGQTYVGYLIIRKITTDTVEAHLHLDVTASTPSGSYTQIARFDGDYKFAHSDQDVTQPSGTF
ncbi:MAG TPA: hypothetical protein VMV72_20075 [Verrucomicrobiae bacterium]|nr:hypothetical protein [Verrucomicrobiae bacterium]